MNYFAPPAPFVLHSDFSPDECERRLREEIDAERPTVFGFSGYRGSKPFLGQVDGKRIRVLQRIYSNRNTLPTVFTGELQGEGTGTQLKGTFDLETTSKIAICLFSVVGLFILALIISSSYRSHPMLSVIFLCGYGGLLLFGPRIFRGIALDQEKNIAEFLREVLVARDGPSYYVSGGSAGR